MPTSPRTHEAGSNSERIFAAQDPQFNEINLGSTASYQSNPQLPHSGHATPARNITPDPGLLTQPFSTAIKQNTHEGFRNPTSPTTRDGDMNGPLSSPQSPHSPRSPRSLDFNHSKPPRERFDDQTAPEGVSRQGTLDITREDASAERVSPPVRAAPYHQLRNVSSPVSRSIGSTPPASPMRTASTPFTSASVRPELRTTPRTSSIDSAISTISSGTSHSHKSSQDSVGSSTADITYLINTAGSPEAVIRHLLKEKQYSAVQNAQLWRLVDKQRTLIFGLNQDLERALKDKERYRKAVKEQLPPLPSLPSSTAPAAAERGGKPDVTTNSSPTHGTTEMHEPQNDEGSSRELSVDSTLNTTNGSILSGAAEIAVVDSNSATEAPIPAVKSREPSHTFDPSLRTVTPIQTANLEQTPGGVIGSLSPAEGVVSPSSFTAKRSQTFNQPSFQFTESTPPSSAVEKLPPTSRKLPPAPLDLHPPARELKPLQYGPGDHSDSEYEETLEVDEIPAFERGRKKTREEDDREREAALLKEQQIRSRSKREKGSKTPVDTTKLGTAETQQAAMPAAASGSHPLDEDSSQPAAPASLASILSPSDPRSSNTKSVNLTVLPMSPGLPVSPRPVDRPLKSPNPRMPRDVTGAYGASPPLSPRNGFVGLPLSPRAPRQPIPLPPQTPLSIASPATLNIELRKEPVVETPEVSHAEEAMVKPATIANLEPHNLGAGGIFRGFISDSYPDLLLPPNALPSIIVRVNSSRLRPSRQSYLAPKTSEEETVFTLGVSARSNMRELWQVEKPLLSLAQLDQQIRKTTTFDAKLPDRSLFNGHAPAKIDARRTALERYFENILDTPMDEKAAVILCRYISSQAFEPSSNEASRPWSPTKVGSDGRLTKEGYLTKRGKNFGGWKARYFVLTDPVLKYYESPGGSLLGTIKLQNAQIGRQSSQQASHSPSRGLDDSEGQYRHAFLILEPKRKDSSSYVRHVLCAENDAERDVWVQALLYHVEGQDRARPSTESSSKSLRKQIAKKDGMVADSPESESFEGLQAVSYENTIPAQAPVISILPQKVDTDGPSPPSPGSGNASKAISGPCNGAKIEDAGAWGNKPQQRERKRGIWGFRDKTADLATPPADDNRMSVFEPAPFEPPANVRPCFGVPLAEAVESCPPIGVDVCLPAVVYRCLEYLDAQDAASEEGIFRLSGSNVVVKGLRDRFNTHGDFDFLADGHFHDVHAVAGLLKMYLRELPFNVLTSELRQSFIDVLNLDSQTKKATTLNGLVHRLPKANWTLIKALSTFLIGIVNNSNVNRMSIRNVGIVFSQTLNIPPPVISMFLREFDTIFAEPPSTQTKIINNEPLEHDDTQSPRPQLISEILTPPSNQSSFAHGNSYEGNPRIIKESKSTPLQSAFSGQVVPGPEPSTNTRSLAPDSAVKARRRESSMLLMGAGQRKSSMPLLHGSPGQ
ncbi:MAG: hypothetical protein LQ351_000321 [Letrouitia transgressa]|nr:MAG: hypothetical protein LQ351_000321 [Letrouitia transgressa]